MGMPMRRGGAAAEGRRTFETMRSEMGRLLERATAPAPTGSWMPMAEEEDAGDSYIVRAELPGVPAENVDIELEGNELTITGELNEEKRGKVLSRRTGKFFYRSSLPGGVESEKIDADLTDGILTVRMPKSEKEARRKIEIGGVRKSGKEA